MGAREDEAVAELVTAIRKRATKNKGTVVVSVSQTTNLLLIWLNYLRSLISNPDSAHLLDGIQGTVIEVAGYVSLGLARPSVFALRGQLEQTLAWIYFNDHPVEFAQIDNDQHEYPLRGKLKAYMNEYGGRFSKRFALLSDTRTRTEEDPYGLLSNHVHYQSEHSAPKVGPLKGLVDSERRCNECAKLQGDVSEYLTDTLSAWFANSWHDWPDEIKKSLSDRLSQKNLKDFSKKFDVVPPK